MTVGSGIAPDLLTPAMRHGWALAGLPHEWWLTAGGDFHPALKTYCYAAVGGMKSIVRLVGRALVFQAFLSFLSFLGFLAFTANMVPRQVGAPHRH